MSWTDHFAAAVYSLDTARWYYALLRTVDDHSNRLRFDD